MGGVPFGPETLPYLDRILGIFRAGGLPDRVAGVAGDVISTFIDGFALEESMWESPAPRVRQRTPGGRCGRPSSDTSRSCRPTVSRTWSRSPSTMFDNSNDDRFDLGIEIIIRGLASFVEETEAAELPGGQHRKMSDHDAGRGDPQHGVCVEDLSQRPAQQAADG